MNKGRKLTKEEVSDIRLAYLSAAFIEYLDRNIVSIEAQLNKNPVWRIKQLLRKSK